MATNNNNMRARSYTSEYLGALETVFGVKRAFARAFQALQIKDGVRDNETAFTVKTNNTPVVIRPYDKDANVGMGTGTGKTSRFGNRTEIIYADTPVPYLYELAIHEGLDIATVNADLDGAVLDRLYLQSEAQVRDMNAKNGAFIAGKAGNSEVLASLDEEDVIELFNDLAAYYINQEVVVPVSAYLKADLYNAIVDSKLVSTGKGSSVNIDENGLIRFKNFFLQPEPEGYFDDANDVAYFVPDEALIPFVGIQLARAIESEDFAGVALQALAKGGSFVLDDNKKAITKVTLTPATSL